MLLVLGLGIWVAFGPSRSGRYKFSDGSLRTEFEIGHKKGVIEAIPVPSGTSMDWSFVVWLSSDRLHPRKLTESQVEAFAGPETVTDLLSGQNPILRFFRVSSWTNLTWVALGFLGQGLFSGRMVLQWLSSERSRQSTISESFWWFSLAGGVLLFAYFIWRQDPVPLIGQASGIVVYARNIRLFRKHARRTKAVLPARASHP